MSLPRPPTARRPEGSVPELGDRTKQNRPTRRFASLPETAEYLGVSTKTVRRRVADGTFTAYRCGPRLTRLDLNEVARESIEFLSTLAIGRKVELVSVITPK